MTDLAITRRLAQPMAHAPVIEWLRAHPDIIALTALMTVAAILRFWDLDAKAMHHDESLHAQFTWYLYNGDGYKHDPLMHGPFLFHSGALVFFLFGDSDYTSRVLPALFGTALVGMPYLLRKQVGITAVLIAAVVLTFSPTLLYYSRFFRNELYMAVWTLGIVICIWRYLDEAKPLYLYVMAALMALSFATKEVTFITVAIILVFVDFMLAAELAKRREGEVRSEAAGAVRTAVLAPFAWLIAAAWPLLGRQPFGRERLPLVGDVLVVLGTLALPQFAAGIQVLPFVGDDGYRRPSEANLTVTTVMVLLLASAYVGLMWRPKVWLIAAACFFVPFVLLYTTFFTNQPAPWTDAFWSAQGGFWSGIWGSLDYWLGQHHEKRGNQPVYYYALMTPLYEFLPLLLTLAGAAWFALRGDSFRRWLLFWIAGIFIGLSIAGEKMPWLEMHIALPLTLAGAIALAGVIERVGLAGAERWRTAAVCAALSAAAVFLLVEGSFPLRVTGGVLMVALLGGALAAAIKGGFKAFARPALAVAVAALFILTARAAIVASFQNDDTPVDMLVYTQTSPEIPRLVGRIDAIAKQSGLGLNLPIVVDPTDRDGFAWPWAWYLRHYHNVSYANISAQGYVPPEGAVLLVSRTNAARINPEGYALTPYKHRWWFLEEGYRALLPPDVENKRSGLLGDARELASNTFDVLTDAGRLQDLGHFFLYRRSVETGTGSVDGVAFFPESLAGFDTEPAVIREAPPPVTLADGRVVIGRGGNGRGELLQPADVFVDGEGNIWVADAQNHRVQKFDPSGRFAGLIGRAGSRPGSFNEPWGVAVDAEGFVYVADTWNHRIQKFSPDLQFVASWGQPGAGAGVGPLDLFGPRDIVFMPDGGLLVTDTGNKRAVRYSKEGLPQAVTANAGDRLGQFDEPVGVTVDALGRLLIADTWNGRILRLGPNATDDIAIPTSWSSREIFAKPYLAVLSDGRILASDPANGLLLLFSADGRSLGTWRPDVDSQPVGVAALPDGGFVFSDSRRNEIQIVPAAMVGVLFR